MTIMEALSEGLVTTVVGLSIVFSVLIILMIVLMLMKVFFYKDPAKVNTEVKTEIPVAKAPVAAEIKNSDDMDESELVAVLTAAIAASLNTSTYNLKIKSYKRVTNSAPAWNKAGLNDVINSRY